MFKLLFPKPFSNLERKTILCTPQCTLSYINTCSVPFTIWASLIVMFECDQVTVYSTEDNRRFFNGMDSKMTCDTRVNMLFF